MTFYEKYPQLRDKNFLAKVLADTVFSTMSLEDQTVSRPKINKIVQKVLREQELKGNQFFVDKHS
ncbi:hypothetical protein GCM10023189_41110 [Nibrella saemangeumensis]|uniref:Uncharacterized protein n=1 Tax=Nibrella saemangeumensis TaxID=1084526 RepID=A0ABP8NBU4_9BACT